MLTFYERLEKDTAAARQRFMDIPLVRDLLGSGRAATPVDAAAAAVIRRVYTRFLQDSYYHVRAAAKVYALAGSRMSEADEGVREWLLHHAVDEYGHHGWVLDDLRVLGTDPRELTGARPSVWCEALVGYMYYVAGHANPMGIIGDTYVIEGLSQLFASQLANTMMHALDIPAAAVSYLSKHGEADQGHMLELQDLVNKHVHRETDYQDILQVSKTEFALFGAIVENLTS
jgi:hypothetical protein